MRSRKLHSWEVTPKKALAIQNDLAFHIVTHNDFSEIKTVAGADIALDEEKKLGFGGVLVYRYPELTEIERAYSIAPLTFPYTPGLLAFREAPILLQAFTKLRIKPDLIFFDGQGIAHPRRMGIASHMGLLLNLPTIGCAKKVLVGKYQEPDCTLGSQTPLIEKNETIGMAVRSRFKTKPIFVSVGHKIDLPTALQLTLSCLSGTRIPKPTKEADHYVAQVKRAFTNLSIKDKGLG